MPTKQSTPAATTTTIQLRTRDDGHLITHALEQLQSGSLLAEDHALENNALCHAGETDVFWEGQEPFYAYGEQVLLTEDGRAVLSGDVDVHTRHAGITSITPYPHPNPPAADPGEHESMKYLRVLEYATWVLRSRFEQEQGLLSEATQTRITERATTLAKAEGTSAELTSILAALP